MMLWLLTALFIGGLTGWLLTSLAVKLLFRTKTLPKTTGDTPQRKVPASQLLLAEKAGNYAAELLPISEIEHKLTKAQDILFWRGLLLSLSGYELYLKTYTRGQHNNNVVDHIIFNKDFPRSLIYSLVRIKRYLEKVAEDTKLEESVILQRNLGRICSRVEFADLEMIQRESLPHFLYSLRKDLVEFSNQFTRIYFSYA